MIRFLLACDKSSASSGRPCAYFEAPAHTPLDEADGWVSATIDEHGWARHGDQHLCPEHNPATVGVKVAIKTGDYTELMPGVRVRLPHGTFVSETMIEVQLDDRECHGQIGAVCGGGTGPYGG